MSSESEHWLYIKNGKFMEHFENDGYSFIRNGAEAREQEVDLNHIRCYYGKVYEEIVQLLKKAHR